jgi:hypothetical protein
VRNESLREGETIAHPHSHESVAAMRACTRLKARSHRGGIEAGLHGLFWRIIATQCHECQREWDAKACHAERANGML